MSDITKIEYVLLDWGGVISQSGTPDEINLMLARNIGVPYEEAKALLSSSAEALKRGIITEEIFWTQLEEHVGRSITERERDIWIPIENFAPHPLMLKLIDHLKSHNYPIGILSNTFPGSAAGIREKGWYEGFKPLLLSSDIGLAKPDMELYRLTLRELGVNASSVVFIDDQDKCLFPAKELGFHTIKAIAPEQIIKDLCSVLNIDQPSF